MYYTPDDIKNSEKNQKNHTTILPLPSCAQPSNGIYYWCHLIPQNLKTRHNLLLQHRQPKRDARVQALKRTICDHKWRFGGSPETISEALIDRYRQEARQGSLSEAEFHYLKTRGYAAESHLYDLSDTEPLAPTESNGRNFFHHFSFDGSHPDQYINEANALRSNRRTFKSNVSRPDILDHLRGFNVVGPVRQSDGGSYNFISWDLDRHTDIDPQEFVSYVMKVYEFLVKNLPDCAIVAQVNPKNGSTVFFCFFQHKRIYALVHGLVSSLDAKAKREIPGYTTPEIYPVFGPGKVFLPFNPEKITLGDTGIWPKTRTKKTKTCSPMVVYSLASFPEYVCNATKANSDSIKKTILVACERPMKAKKSKKNRSSNGKKKSAGVGGMGSVPKFRGRFLRTMVDFFQGKLQPEADTIDKFLTPWARAIAIVEECWDFDELKEKLQGCIDLIPDTSFSDRLSDDPAELERVLEYKLRAIIKNNGYQARPDESTRIFLNLKKFCDRIGFVPSDPDTWAVLDNAPGFAPTLDMVWTPELARFIRDIAPILNCTLSQAKELLKLVFNWIEAKNELSYSLCASLMNRVGIKAHNDKVAAFFAATRQNGFIAKAKNYGHFMDAGGKMRQHGNFYVNTSKVVFRQQLSGEALDQPNTYTQYLLYLSFLSSDSCDFLLEHRRLNVDERYGRRIRGLYQNKFKNVA